MGGLLDHLAATSPDELAAEYVATFDLQRRCALHLTYRRPHGGPVFSATTRMDKLMYLVLATVIVLGLWNTVVTKIFGHYDYRTGVSIWFRGIFGSRCTQS